MFNFSWRVSHSWCFLSPYRVLFLRCLSRFQFDCNRATGAESILAGKWYLWCESSAGQSSPCIPNISWIVKSWGSKIKNLTQNPRTSAFLDSFYGNFLGTPLWLRTVVSWAWHVLLLESGMASVCPTISTMTWVLQMHLKKNRGFWLRVRLFNVQQWKQPLQHISLKAMEEKMGNDFHPRFLSPGHLEPCCGDVAGLAFVTKSSCRRICPAQQGSPVPGNDRQRCQCAEPPTDSRVLLRMIRRTLNMRLENASNCLFAYLT